MTAVANENDLAILNDVADQQGYLKAGFLGFQKSGKTWTAMLLAIALKQRFNLPGPIAFFDTEGGSVYVKPVIKELTGEDALATRKRSLGDLLAWGKACVNRGVSVAIVDSITHPWRELCETFLQKKNDQLLRMGRGTQQKLQFQDWAAIKEQWARWTTFYLNSPLHIVICGRAGYEYDFEEEEDGTKNLVKTGIKMKTEGEFGFEPSLLVEMQRSQDLSGVHRIVRTAVVLGDRFGVIDGKTADFPSLGDHKAELAAVERFFAPHLELLVPGAHAPVDTETRTEVEIEAGEDRAAAERRRRVILCEEIQGELVKVWPGQTAAEKKHKAAALEKHFGTMSWTAVETMSVAQLTRGLIDLRKAIAAMPAAAGKDGE